MLFPINNELSCSSMLMATPSKISARTLSFGQAAEAIGVRRWYVEMLCEAGRLTRIDSAEGAEAEVSCESIERYIAQSILANQDAPSVRQAGAEAKLYDHDDTYYTARRPAR